MLLGSDNAYRTVHAVKTMTDAMQGEWLRHHPRFDLLKLFPPFQKHRFLRSRNPALSLSCFPTRRTGGLMAYVVDPVQKLRLRHEIQYPGCADAGTERCGRREFHESKLRGTV